MGAEKGEQQSAMFEIGVPEADSPHSSLGLPAIMGRNTAEENATSTTYLPSTKIVKNAMCYMACHGGLLSALA